MLVGIALEFSIRLNLPGDEDARDSPALPSLSMAPEAQNARPGNRIRETSSFGHSPGFLHKHCGCMRLAFRFGLAALDLNNQNIAGSSLEDRFGSIADEESCQAPAGHGTYNEQINFFAPPRIEVVHLEHLHARDVAW